MLKQFTKIIKKRSRLSVAIIIGIALVGTILTFDSRASTPYASIAADKGSLAGGAVAQNDTSASDGRSVIFGQANPSHQAVSAYSFVNSIGVGTHLYDLNLSYGNTTAVVNSLTNAGIKHIRDGYSVPKTLPWATYLSDETSIFRQVQAAGIYIDLGITGCPNDATSASPATWASTVVANLDVSKIDYFELTNEIDNFCGSNWLTGAASYMQAFSNAIRSSPTLKSIPIIGPSFVNESAVTSLGDLSSYIDYGNIHPYMNATPPSADYIDDNQKAFIAPDSGSKPIIATETGETTAALTSTDGFIPVPESVQAVYTINTYLEQWNAGIKRTYIYELADNSDDTANNNNTSESHFGIVNYDFTAKPSYTAIKNLISLLSDPSDFSAGSLNYTITGGTATTDSLLMEKQNGSYWLAIWQDDSLYNRDNRTSIAPTQVPVKLSFSKPMASIKTYDPLQSTSPVSTTTNVSSYNLTSTPSVTLVNINP
jgi:hypothetical protein